MHEKRHKEKENKRNIKNKASGQEKDLKRKWTGKDIGKVNERSKEKVNETNITRESER